MCRLISFVLIFSAVLFKVHCHLYIDNFQKNGEISSWIEHSDTVMPEGKSKSSFVILNTKVFRRAILFTMLKPHVTGAAIAGVRKNVNLDISKYETISLKIKGHGEYNGYEFFVKHNGDNFHVPSFVHYFEAPSRFMIVHLPINAFKPYYKGKLENYGPLSTNNITTVGILAYGGLHLTKKQRGVAGLEIDWIKLK